MSPSAMRTFPTHTFPFEQPLWLFRVKPSVLRFVGVSLRFAFGIFGLAMVVLVLLSCGGFPSLLDTCCRT